LTDAGAVGEVTGDAWAGRFCAGARAGGDARCAGGAVTGVGAAPPAEGGDAPRRASRRRRTSSGSSGFIFLYIGVSVTWR